MLLNVDYQADVRLGCRFKDKTPLTKSNDKGECPKTTATTKRMNPLTNKTNTPGQRQGPQIIVDETKVM